MIKKLLLAIATLAASAGLAFAQVDVNKGDEAALNGVKGLGPSTTKAILDERAKGEFRDWADLQKRVKGMGEKKAAKLSEAGLQVNGKAKEGAAMTAKGEAKAAKASAAKDAGAAKESSDAKGSM